MKPKNYGPEFEERAVRAMRDKVAVLPELESLAHLIDEQERAASGSNRDLTADGLRLKANFERDRIAVGEHMEAATKAMDRRWVISPDLAPNIFRDRLHFFGADRDGTGGPRVYNLNLGLIEGTGAGAGIGIGLNLREGKMWASHYVLGTTQMSSYAGIGMSIVPSLEHCLLSIRPVVNWNGYDILNHRFYDPKVQPSAWGVASAELGLHVQSSDLAGGSFRDDGGHWIPLWKRSEINPSGQRNYNDMVDARSLSLDVLASSNRRYVIWVSCRALVISQAKFGLDIYASSSVGCQIPYVVVEEMIL